ncbi:carboxypeptidase-like regulatory domain-containing protein [Flaviaesturariibacter amylovorans]|uniref:Carboxypeptidase regulatory-like domain-containing protein n=1 Tax=Flaviaesturariibacter amylovorans TaxID=1084520 RepID=A0ABP8HQG0_9BACT
MHRKLLTALLATLLFTACRKMESYENNPVPSAVAPDPVSATLQGTVLDETGAPAAGVTVRAGSRSATTDNNGHFRITGAALDRKASVVTAQKNGYFKAVRSFAATSGANEVRIKLIPRRSAGSFDAAAGGAVSLANGAQVTLPAGAVMLKSGGGTYSGTVHVYAAYIDPTAPDIAQTIPGSLMADDKDGRRVTLASYGMMSVELQGASGEALQVKTGQQATLKMPIPAARAAAAPASIALWYVDEATGLWKEEGTATKQGDSYIGTVKHFSFWNCDIGLNGSYLNLTLGTAGGAPIAHTIVWLSAPRPDGAFDFVYGFTDSLGQVSGYVPNGLPITLRLDNACGNTYHTQALGTFSQNTSLALSITPQQPALVTVTGTLLTCAGTPVTDGYANIRYGFSQAYVATNASGAFSVTLPLCPSWNEPVRVRGVDAGNIQQSAEMTFPVTGSSISTGPIAACGNIDYSFINYSIDGSDYRISTIRPGDTVRGYPVQYAQPALPGTQIAGSRSVANEFIYFSFENGSAQAPGTYPLRHIYVNGSSGPGTAAAGSTVTVTRMALQQNQYYEGSFSGTFTDGQNTTHTLNGTFRALRDRP